MRNIKRILALAGLTVSAAVCIVAGFGGVWLQDAFAALLPNPPAQVIEIEVPEPVMLYTEADIDMLARLIYTEARGVESKTEQAAVVWCVLNRLDNPARGYADISAVVTAPHQFAYRSDALVIAEFRELAADVLERWQAERQGQTEVGRVLPAEYQYFEGDGRRNWFSASWRSDDFWDWGLTSPYED